MILREGFKSKVWTEAYERQCGTHLHFVLKLKNLDLDNIVFPA